ncbi:hypothetical protein BCR35DRAFT_299858 [Leucosporidium creatinivorum]|uniref:Uncharacterized protein n=1 Tax=Leucosporidium creatinivorum TaxID=106004 RepID=A0A1Y2G2J3_9BASI|nr:hypothetical protein BCR35DRAFT_299858 [Leucosporidium creatinivorum]
MAPAELHSLREAAKRHALTSLDIGIAPWKFSPLTPTPPFSTSDSRSPFPPNPSTSAASLACGRWLSTPTTRRRWTITSLYLKPH